VNASAPKYIVFLNSKIGYYRIGSGDQPVIALHGYGESGAHFAYLQQTAGEQNRTILAIDLPFHGQTEWKDGLTVTAAHLQGIFRQILEAEQLKNNTSFELWGYSMGGRIALGYFQAFPLEVRKLIIIAPDGIYVNPWYRFATATRFGNIIFKRTMQHPTWFMNLLNAGYRLKLINKSIFKFATNYVDDPQVRHDLYIRWTAFRKIHPSKNKLLHLIKKHQVPVTGIYGEFDRIIPYSKAEKFWEKITSKKNVFILSDGHKLLQSKYACYLWKD
jgi:pimeloyl-ACP methyl ester carboxylesterase